MREVPTAPGCTPTSIGARATSTMRTIGTGRQDVRPLAARSPTNGPTLRRPCLERDDFIFDSSSRSVSLFNLFANTLSTFARHVLTVLTLASGGLHARFLDSRSSRR